MKIRHCFRELLLEAAGIFF